MLIKPITYNNYNGEKKTKNFYFNLTKTEITKMQFRNEGTLQDYLKKMVESQNNKEIYKFFENFVLMCYGEKSADGEEFLKSEEIRNRFQCHPAYDVLMMEFIDGGDKAMGDFINAVVPKDIADGYSKIDKVDEVNKLVGFDYIKKEES